MRWIIEVLLLNRLLTPRHQRRLDVIDRLVIVAMLVALFLLGYAISD